MALVHDATREWTGTLVIAEWAADRIVLDLVDGTDRPVDPATGACVPSERTLTLVGERGPVVERGVNDSAPVMHDAATGEPLCPPGFPEEGA